MLQITVFFNLHDLVNIFFMWKQKKVTHKVRCKNISCGNLISRRTACIVIQSSLGEIYATAWVVLARVRETHFMGLCREMFYRSIWVEGKLSNQAKEFIHFRMVFLRVMGRWSTIRTGEIAAALTRLWHQTVLVKRELRQKAKLLIYYLIYISALAHGHELWVVSKRKRSIEWLGCALP